ncbi:unnamed protein product [Psylliodes chrysocephalus]|uniref:Uncharacterized protein n=1 Tax=Psylliodes chrysocephalus TaxID=3402493 RepID=A0A9P0CHB1_9CUCU|nr:unnamed protein product [Psylliodes chrysocephala]
MSQRSKRILKLVPHEVVQATPITNTKAGSQIKSPDKKETPHIHVTAESCITENEQGTIEQNTNTKLEASNELAFKVAHVNDYLESNKENILPFSVTETHVIKETYSGDLNCSQQEDFPNDFQTIKLHNKCSIQLKESYRVTLQNDILLDDVSSEEAYNPEDESFNSEDTSSTDGPLYSSRKRKRLSHKDYIISNDGYRENVQAVSHDASNSFNAEEVAFEPDLVPKLQNKSADAEDGVHVKCGRGSADFFSSDPCLWDVSDELRDICTQSSVKQNSDSDFNESKRPYPDKIRFLSKCLFTKKLQNGEKKQNVDGLFTIKRFRFLRSVYDI